MNKYTHKLILLGMVLLWQCTTGIAQELTFSLEEAKSYAIEHSYFAQTAALEQEMAIKKLKETTAIGLPQINGSVEFNNFLQLPTSLVPDFANPGSGNMQAVQFGTNYNLTGGITASQIIFNGSYLVGLQAAKSYKEMSEKVVIKTEREIKDMVTQSYGNVIVAVENVKTIQKNKEYLDVTLSETKQLYEAGFAREQDVDQLTILTQSAANQFNRAQRYLAITENLLKFQMGIDVDQEITLTDSLSYIITYGNDSSIVNQKFDVNSHIDYLIALNNAELQLMNYKNTKAALMPDLSAFLSYQQQFQSNEFDLDPNFWYPTAVWGLKLNIPIFSSLNKTYSKQQASLNYKKSQVEASQTEQNLMVEFLTLKSEYQFAVDQYKNAQNNLELVQGIVEKETIKYNEGMSSSLNLANAQIQFFEIQASYINSILSMIKARSNMDKILSNY